MGLGRRDHRRQLHAEEKLAEEALLRRFEARARRGLGTAVEGRIFEPVDHRGQFERTLHVAVNDAPGVGIGIVDRDLLARQLVAQDLIFDAGEAERPRGVEAERLQVAGHQLHRRDAALADARNELLTVAKGRFRAPEPEPHGISEVVDVGRARGRGIEDAGAGQVVLEQHAGNALLRALLLAECALAASDAAHLVRLVEADDAFEVLAGPVDDLLEAAVVTARRAKRGVGDEEHALLERDCLIDLPVGERLDVSGKAAKRGPVTAGVLKQRLVLGNPDVAPAAGKPAVENAGRDLPALPRARAVAEEIAHAVGTAVFRLGETDALLGGFEPSGQELVPGVAGIDDGFELRSR